MNTKRLRALIVVAIVISATLSHVIPRLAPRLASVRNRVIDFANARIYGRNCELCNTALDHGTRSGTTPTKCYWCSTPEAKHIYA